MKLVVIVLFACLLSAVQSFKDVDKKIYHDCKEANNVTDEECKNFRDSNFDKSKASKNLKCGMKCFLERSGMLADGQLVANAIIEHESELDAANVRNVVEKCNMESGLDECDVAFQKGICFMTALNINRIVE